MAPPDEERENAYKARTYQAWWLKETCANDVQAFVGSAFKHLCYGTILLLAIPETGRGGEWLAAAPATPASEPREGQHRAAALALTADGLVRSGFPAEELKLFPPAFTEGMTQNDRARRLGDRLDKKDAPGTVIEGGLLWSGANPPLGRPDADADPARIHANAHVQIHAILCLYADSEKELADFVDEVSAALKTHSVRIAREVPLTRITALKSKPMREHFGFADGISQPLPEDDPSEQEAFRAVIYQQPGPALTQALEHHRIKTGDILLGRRDAYGERPGAIFLPTVDDPAKALPQGTAPQGYRDFSWNGSFLVARQLHQDVTGFWSEMHRCGATQGLPPRKLAEKIVGRAIDGALLIPGAAPGHGGASAEAAVSNDRGFADLDPHGFGCPFGSHIRRANPRDSGARTKDERATRRDASNNHRILRRGRPYGPPLLMAEDETIGAPPLVVFGDGDGPQLVDDGAERGLIFMCLNTDIERQFEFIQQTWLMNDRFAASGETDPLVGPHGLFSFPYEPVRRRIAVQTFTRLVGGEYFFMPSLSALRWLRQRTAPPDEPVADSSSALQGETG